MIYVKLLHVCSICVMFLLPISCKGIGDLDQYLLHYVEVALCEEGGSSRVNDNEVGLVGCSVKYVDVLESCRRISASTGLVVLPKNEPPQDLLSIYVRNQDRWALFYIHLEPDKTLIRDFFAHEGCGRSRDWDDFGDVRVAWLACRLSEFFEINIADFEKMNVPSLVTAIEASLSCHPKSFHSFNKFLKSVSEESQYDNYIFILDESQKGRIRIMITEVTATLAIDFYMNESDGSVWLVVQTYFDR